MRPTRITETHVHYHVILRCNNGERLLRNPDDCERTIAILSHYSRFLECRVFNYVVMPSHIHLMVEPIGQTPLDRIMHDFCLAVARDYNKRRQRGGHFWRQRYRSHIIDDDRYALACLRYLHRNPVAAGLVQKMDDWPWSAYHCYALGKPDRLVTPHPSYLLFGNTPEERQAEYRLFADMGADIAAAERTIIEGEGKETSRRFERACRSVMASIGNYLMQRRYRRT